jgi:drug/metabolite transporter (DMT)-like permease
MTSYKNQRLLSPLIVIIIGILAVSTASIFIRYAHQHATSLIIAAYRLSIASLILAPIATLKYRDSFQSIKRQELIFAFFSGVFLALHFATWITSLEFTTVASSVTLVSTTPLWVAILSPFALGESISRPVAIGLIVALVGGGIIGISDSCVQSSSSFICPQLHDFIKGEAFIGDLLALAGAVFGAGYLMIGRRLRAKISFIIYIFIVYGIASIVLIAMVFISRQVSPSFPPETYLWLLLLALIPQLLGHSSFNWALRHLSATYVSITLLGEPIGSTILAYIILNEVPTQMKVIGAILILIGIFFASRNNSIQSGNPIKK